MGTRKNLRRHGNKPVEEIDETGKVIRTYEDPYELQEELSKEIKGLMVSTIVQRLKLAKKIHGRRFRFKITGDYEITSNNLPDCEGYGM